MPLWQIYHPEGTLTDPATKLALVRDITAMYTAAGLPAFYVNVVFLPQPPDNLYVANAPRTAANPFLRAVIKHIAITQPNEDAQYARVTGMVDRILGPVAAAMGADWEYHVEETERRLWKINGLAPPPWRSEAEAVWREGGKAVPWEEGRVERANV